MSTDGREHEADEVHVVPQGTLPTRLDEYISGVFPRYTSRSSGRKSARRGEVWVDGEPWTSSRFIGEGARIELKVPEPSIPKTLPLSLAIHYEDPWLAVVEKIPGISVNGNRHRTIEHALPHNLKVAPGEQALPWPRPVHRLDFPTGGLLLVAKTSSVLAALSELFSKREIEKRYRGIVMGEITEERWVNLPIDGRSAVTQIRPLNTIPSLKSSYLTTVDLWPKTGRTHQLRRHLAAIGTPLLGDVRYAGDAGTLRGKGLFLWAIGLAFSHPITHQQVCIKIMPPQKFQTVIGREQRRFDKFSKSSHVGDSSRS